MSVIEIHRNQTNDIPSVFHNGQQHMCDFDGKPCIRSPIFVIAAMKNGRRYTVSVMRKGLSIVLETVCITFVLFYRNVCNDLNDSFQILTFLNNRI